MSKGSSAALAVKAPSPSDSSAQSFQQYEHC